MTTEATDPHLGHVEAVEGWKFLKVSKAVSCVLRFGLVRIVRTRIGSARAAVNNTAQIAGSI